MIQAPRRRPGSQQVAEVRAAALSQGFTNGTLRRAFRELAGQATRDDAKKWWWSLPDGEGIAPRDEAGQGIGE